MGILKVVTYSTRAGKEPFTDWLEDIDIKARAIVLARIARVRLGNFGDCKLIKDGNGILELRIRYGAGYRIYFGREGVSVILLLMGGDKGSQNRDIAKAKRYWLKYKES